MEPKFPDLDYKVKMGPDKPTMVMVTVPRSKVKETYKPYKCLVRYWPVCSITCTMIIII